MKNLPLVSFCITTYKRPEFLKSTIEAVLGQKYDNLEIVISEDPSDNDSENIVKKFNSKKITYVKNKKRLGMTKSYNKAIFLAKGKFITLLADDDPPTSDMMETFLVALKKYSHVKAFFGGSYVNVTTENIEKVTHLKKGFHSLINKEKEYGSMELLDSETFFKKFLKQELFPHYQWTAAVISKDLIAKIGGVPDYNSAHFIDYAYLLKIADISNFVIINKELATFALHELSYGKKKSTLDEYKRGVVGFDKVVSKLTQKYGCKSEYKKFLTNYVIMFLVNRLEHYKTHKYDISPSDLVKTYEDLGKKLAFLKNRKWEVYLKLNYGNAYKILDPARKIYGSAKISLLRYFS